MSSFFSFFRSKEGSSSSSSVPESDSFPGPILFPTMFNAERVTIERIDLTKYYPHRESAPYALVLHNVLNNTECNQLIGKSESQKFEPAQINIGGGEQMLITDRRNNDRTFIDDESLAEEIWRRIVSVLSSKAEPQLHTQFTDDGDTKWTAVGMNERLRVLRYDPGTYFAPHYDGCYKRNDPSHPQYGDVSFVTAQIYLNDEFKGGATAFLDPNSHDPEAKFDVVPKTGSILLFEHRLLHEGSIIEKGRKYTIRSDIMYHKA